MYKVLHFVRKNSQLKASFVKNQILMHSEYTPLIVFRKKEKKQLDGGFTEFNLTNFNYLNLNDNEKWFEKFLFQTIKILSQLQLIKVLRFISDNQIDICHFHYGTDCGVFFPLPKKLKVPSVVSFYGYDSSSFPKYLFGYGRLFLKNRVFKRVTAILAMSPDMEDDLINAGCPKEKIIVHYYGTDCSIFYQKRNYSYKAKIKILFLACLVPQKGHLFLLKSLEQLVHNGVVNFELRIVGSGELEAQLIHFVKSSTIHNHVSFHGAIRYASPQMMAEYQNADIFVHPSVIAPNGDKEGIPGTIVEAMSAGLPVISTYHAGIPYIIENEKTGLLVKEWDIDELATSIARLIESRDLREKLGKAGQNYAVANLDIHEKEK